MPRSKTKLEYNSFIKGLITEAGPLTFPDNASLIDENFVLNRDGSRQRRLGMKYEPDYTNLVVTSIEGTDTATRSYTWKSVNSDGDLDIAIIQVGNSLYFYDNNVSPITGSPLNGGSAETVGTITDTEFSFTESYGKLIIANGSETVYVLTYDSAGDTISQTSFRLEVRDLFGVYENVSIDNRPFPLTTVHHYNLRNQGWVNSLPCAVDMWGSQATGIAITTTDPVAYTNSKLGVYPSNADMIAFGKMSAAEKIPAINSYSPWELAKSVQGSSHSPRGTRIIDVFNRGDSRNSLMGGGLINDETVGGCRSAASYAGRVFYILKVDSTNATDANSPSLGSMIFFSRTTDNIADLGKCYSVNDPTAEEFNDPLDTDGGFITIPDSGEMYTLATLGESIFVFTSRGVWEISGGDTYFSATNQKINKVADFGAYSASSVISGESMLSFWSSGGIYAIIIDDTSLKGKLQNLTQTTIQSKFDRIDSEAKRTATGTYDDISKQVRWLYREGSLPNNYYYNRELIYDLNLQCFYVNKIQELTMTSGSSPYVIGYIDLSSIVFTDETDLVVAGAGGQVQVGGVDVVSSLRLSDQTTEGSTKYWTLRDLGTGSANITVSGYYDLDFLDWSDETDASANTGKDAKATLLTGYSTDGDAEVLKKAKYITVFMKRTESGFTDDGSGNLTPIGASSCLLQGQWEWTNHIAAGRWSNEAEVYRLPRMYVPTGSGDLFNYGFTVVKTKNKVRGKGSALSLLFTTSPGKDLHLYGWSREVTAPKE